MTENLDRTITKAWNHARARTHTHKTQTPDTQTSLCGYTTNSNQLTADWTVVTCPVCQTLPTTNTYRQTDTEKQ